MPAETSAMSKPALRVIGALLVLAGVSLAAITERALLDHHAGLAQPSNVLAPDAGSTPRKDSTQADSMQTDPMQKAAHAGMRRVSGMPQAAGQPRDPDFDLQAAAPTLLRRVEMFQWREVDGAGGSPHYEQGWVDHPLDAGQFKNPAGHANPGRFPMESRRFDAVQVRVGEFTLSPALLHALPGSQPLSPDMRHVPANLAASFTLYQGALVTSASPAKPRVGDLRVSWQTVPLQVVTVFARVDGDRLVPADTAHGKGFDIELGDQSGRDQAGTDSVGTNPHGSGMLATAAAPPRFAQTRRVIAVLLAALGAWLLGRWQRRYRNGILLALAFGTLPVAIVAGMLWLGHAGAISAGWFGVALVAALVAVWRLRYRTGVD